MSKKILIVGASGDLGLDVLELLSDEELIIGAHYNKNKKGIDRVQKKAEGAKIKSFSGEVATQAQAQRLVDRFVKWAGGIDALVQLSGSVMSPKNWDKISQKEWDRDLAVNLTGPYFLAQAAMKRMKKKGGKVILCSTASAVHGGGATSMAYGAAKAAIECVTKGLARVGASNNILVNSIAPGFIKSKFHTKQMKRDKKQIRARAKMVLLKRAGSPRDVSGMIVYLLSSYGDYITGEVFPISGGDWL